MKPESEDRQKIFDEYYNVSQNIKRPFLAYDRYFEADKIIEFLRAKNINIAGNVPGEGIRVLDYGCGIGDYAMSFARIGAKVYCYDIGYVIDFLKYRSKIEDLWDSVVRHDIDPAQTEDCVIRGLEGIYLVIFGEVLEHLENPLEVIKACGAVQIPWIFTSSYPVRAHDDDVYFNRRGHTKSAHDQQSSCAEFLREHYTEHRLGDGDLTMWKLKS